MVTLQQVQQQREQIKQAQEKIRAQQPRFTQQQLRQSTPLQRQKFISKFEEQKQQALKKFEKPLQQIEGFEKQIKTFQESQRESQVEAAEWKQAEKLLRQGKGWVAEGGVLEKIRKLQKEGYIPGGRTVEETLGAREFVKQLPELREKAREAGKTLEQQLDTDFKEFQRKLETGQIIAETTPTGTQYFELAPETITTELSKVEVFKPEGDISFGEFKEIVSPPPSIIPSQDVRVLKPKVEVKRELLEQVGYEPTAFEEMGIVPPAFMQVEKIQPPTFKEKFVEKYTGLERAGKETLLEAPPIQYLYEKVDPFAEKVLKQIKIPVFVGPGTTTVQLPEPVREFEKGVVVGAVRGPIEKPFTTTATVGAGYLIGKTTTFLPKAISKIPKVGSILKTKLPAYKLTPGISATLGTIYAGTKGFEVAMEPTAVGRGRIIGSAVTTEIIPFMGGVKFSEIDKKVLREVLKFEKQLFKDIRAKTGSKGKSKTKSELKYRRKFSDKSDMEIADQINRRIEGAFKKGKVKKELSDINKQLSRKEAREGFDKYLKELQKRDLVKGYAYDTETGELIFFDRIEPGIVRPKPEPSIIKTDKGISDYGKVEVFEKPRPSYVSTRIEPTRETIEPSKMFFKPTDVMLEEEIITISKPSPLYRDTEQVKVTPIERPSVRLFDLQLSKELQLLRQPQKDLTKQKDIQKIRTFQPLRFGLRQTERLKQKERQRLVPRYMRPRPRPGEPRKPKERKIIIPPWLKDDSKKPKYIRRLQKKPELFIPFVRRFGKFIPVGKAVTKKRAVKIGVTKLRTTLAATLQLRKPSGEIVPITPKGKEFRLGKTPGIIQKAPFRLGTTQERLEIIKSRRGIKLIS